MKLARQSLPLNERALLRQLPVDPGPLRVRLLGLPKPRLRGVLPNDLVHALLVHTARFGQPRIDGGQAAPHLGLSDDDGLAERHLAAHAFAQGLL